MSGLAAGGRRRSKTGWLIVAALVLIGAGLAAGSGALDSRGSRQASGTETSTPTSLYTVERGTVSSQTQVPATLGYAGNYHVVNQAEGILTALPAVGRVVREGQVLYRVNGAPVVLLYGSAPAYRALSSGLTGADVSELDADLVGLGDATTAQIPAGSDRFTSATATALKKLQATLGVTQSGKLELGQAAFEPGPVRVTAVSGQPGGRAPVGRVVLQGTSTARQVSIALDAAQQSEVKVGDMVTITLPDNRTTPGVVSSVGTVASAHGGGSSGSAPTITVLVKPRDPAATGTWDRAPVNVTVTTGRVSHVLVVPVDALLAQVGGGYAVEVVGGGGLRQLVPVSLGLFDDAAGTVQVSGSRLAAGQRVVVPTL